MLRGSSFLLEKSVKFYEPLIEGIATFDNRAWAVDADSYGDDNIRLRFGLVLENGLEQRLDPRRVVYTRYRSFQSVHASSSVSHRGDRAD